jgi:phage terminase large subunit
MTQLAKIKFPDKWKPYPYQVPLWNYLVGGGRSAVAVWHRRAGKDLVGLHWITLCALKNPGVYWYIFPTAEQAKMAIWDAVTLDGKGYLSFLPDDEVSKVDNTNLMIRFHNGSIIKFVGAHRPDSLRGAGIKGAIISEYADVNKPEGVASVIIPMIVRSRGWMLYLYTPSSDCRKIHGYDLYKPKKSSRSG